MKIDSIRNQKGEVMTGVMVIMMAVMMLFGGMHMMHGGRDHRHGDDHDTIEHKRDHEKEGKYHRDHGHEDHDEEKAMQK